jgi:hypothetical protein
MSLDTVAMLAGVLTLATWSFLYKENPIFRFTEHLFVGMSSAYMFVSGIYYIKDYLQSTTILFWIWPMILGLMLYFFFSKNYFFLYRIPIAFIIGMGTAMTVRTVGHARLVKQMVQILTPIIVSGAPTATINNLLILIGTITSLLFFTFTRERKGALALSGRIGRVFIMVLFGANFGRVAMTRFATDINRVESLVKTDAIYVIPVFFALILADIIYARSKKAADTDIDKT